MSSLNSTLKNGYNDKFCYVLFWHNLFFKWGQRNPNQEIPKASHEEGALAFLNLDSLCKFKESEFYIKGAVTVTR